MGSVGESNKTNVNNKNKNDKRLTKEDLDIISGGYESKSNKNLPHSTDGNCPQCHDDMVESMGGGLHYCFNCDMVFYTDW